MINLLISDFSSAETPFIWSSSMRSCSDDAAGRQVYGECLALSCSGVMDEGDRS
jgi:hypothetical protein